MTPKSRRIVNIAAIVIPSLLIAASAVGKLLALPAVVEKLATYGVGQYVLILGITELVCLVLFILPRTMKIGFLLSSCYFAGATATELSHGGMSIGPILPLILLWAAAYIRDKSVFLVQPARDPSSMG